MTAASCVLERMRLEGHMAVNYVTAHVRVPRRENIVSLVGIKIRLKHFTTRSEYACFRQNVQIYMKRVGSLQQI